MKNGQGQSQLPVLSPLTSSILLSFPSEGGSMEPPSSPLLKEANLFPKLAAKMTHTFSPKARWKMVT